MRFRTSRVHSTSWCKWFLSLFSLTPYKSLKDSVPNPPTMDIICVCSLGVILIWFCLLNILSLLQFRQRVPVPLHGHHPQRQHGRLCLRGHHQPLRGRGLQGQLCQAREAPPLLHEPHSGPRRGGGRRAGRGGVWRHSHHNFCCTSK